MLCDLAAALALMISMLAANCATTAAELGLERLSSNGQAYQNPLLLRLYDEQGELHAEWIGQRYGLVGWTTQPELLIFNTTQWSRQYLVAGDPSDGRLYEIQSDVGRPLYRRSPTELAMSGGGTNETVRLPVALAEPRSRPASVVGRLHVFENTVRVDDRVLLEDRGLPHSLSASPSGRWVVAVEDQLEWEPIIYAIAPDGSGRMQTVRVVEPAELPLPRPQPSRTSPDGQWTVTFRSWPWGILVTHRDGEQRLYQGAPVDGPWWSPDSRRFAYLRGSSLSVVDLFDRSGESELPDVFWGGRFVLSPAPRVFLGWMPHGLAWLHLGSSDHGDFALPRRDWRETLE